MDNQTTTTALEGVQENKKKKGFFAGYKDFGGLSTGSKIAHILLPVALIGIIVAVILFASSPDYVPVVKDGKLKNYPDKTVGEAFEAFFEEPSWESFEAENGKQAVNFNGKCEYMGEKVNCLVQFIIDDDGESFELYAVEINGDPISEIEILAMLEAIYE